MLVVSDHPLPDAAPAEVPPADRALLADLGGGPDAFAAERPGEGFWSRLFLVADAPASQFDRLQALCREGRPLPFPFACAARAGRRFHGHRGRAWAAAPGNLHLSAAFAPAGRPAADALGMVMLPVVSAVEAILAASGDRLAPGIKWVNDVLIDGRKVAGVLVATVTQADALEAVVVGVGANVERRPDVVPTPFVPSVACLRDFPGGAALTHDGFLAAILRRLGARAQEVCARGPGILFPAYRELSIVRGRAARILSEEGVEIAAGVVEDILPDLRLVFRGRVDPVDRGRLALI